MKPIDGKSAAQMAEDLAHLKELISALEEERNEIKDYFKENLDEGTTRIGDYEIEIVEATRKTVNKKMLLEDFGKEFVNKYTKITKYRKLNDIKAS